MGETALPVSPFVPRAEQFFPSQLCPVRRFAVPAPFSAALRRRWFCLSPARFGAQCKEGSPSIRAAALPTALDGAVKKHRSERRPGLSPPFALHPPKGRRMYRRPFENGEEIVCPTGRGVASPAPSVWVPMRRGRPPRESGDRRPQRRRAGRRLQRPQPPGRRPRRRRRRARFPGRSPRPPR